MQQGSKTKKFSRPVVSPQEGDCTAEVTVFEQMGSYTIAHLDIGEGEGGLLARVPGRNTSTPAGRPASLLTRIESICSTKPETRCTTHCPYPSNKLLIR